MLFTSAAVEKMLIEKFNLICLKKKRKRESRERNNDLLHLNFFVGILERLTEGWQDLDRGLITAIRPVLKVFCVEFLVFSNL